MQRENQTQKTELGSYKLVKNQLNFSATEAELSNTKKLLNKVLDFVEKLGLKAQLEKFLTKSKKETGDQHKASCDGEIFATRFPAEKKIF